MKTEDEELADSWHALPPEVVLERHGATPAGLDSIEARARLRRQGANELPEAPARPAWLVFLAQFRSPLIYLLVFASALALALGERRDSFVIMLVVIVNSIIGALQERRAQQSMDALRRLAGLQARVLRDGKERVVAARELVVGDVILLAAGDAVAADARLVEANVLATVEAPLTGEPVPVTKQTEAVAADTPLTGRTNLVFSGTHVSAGRGRAVVVATGLATEVGKIARLTATAVEPQTKLEVRITELGRQLLTLAIVVCLAIMAVGWWREIPERDLLILTISQMVSLVPEGLPVALTIALAVGMQRMARRGVIVRRLAAVETLGATSVICTDKTGTLTKGEMTATALWLPDGRTLTVTGVGYEPEGFLVSDTKPLPLPGDDDVRALLEAGALCNDAKLVPPTGAELRWRAFGDPTEAALLTLAHKGGIDPHHVQRAAPRRAEIPFDPAVKMMATQHGPLHGPGRVIVKGAPEVVIELCNLIRRSGGNEPLTIAGRQQTLETAHEFARQALRVLAFAEVPGAELDEADGFDSLRGRGVLLGLVGQMDPPREEVKEAIVACHAAGIRLVMVTGDHRATGLAVAHQLGLAKMGDRAVEGQELESMPEQDLRAGLANIAVFARVLPAQKLRIVEAFQAEGEVVVMTGDGVNDAPALARADVGVAMGLTGTEVAKNAAKVVITDDNFATIVKAIERGRLVYSNIQKLLLFLMTTSIDEVVLLFVALLLGCPLPLLAVQILWINLISEGTLTVNLVMEGLEGDEMQRPPIRSDASLFTPEMWQRMAVMVTTSIVATFGFFLWRLSTPASLELVRTETFTMLAVCQWFNLLNCESATRSVLRFGVWRNKWLLGGLALSNVLQLAVVFLPALNRLFHTVPIPLTDFFLIGAVASLVLWTEEARKLLTAALSPARRVVA